jgi:predicted ATPase
MSAALEWSYNWLPEDEQAMLRQLAIFVGPFALEAAQAVYAGCRILAVEYLANLVDKSLIVADIGGPSVTYRLLDTTKAYGLERLRDCGEFDGAARRHAEYYLETFENAESDLSLLAMPAWLDRYGRHLDNLRSAVEWAFSPGGNVALGIALTIAGAPLWFQLSLADECRRRFERAWAYLEGPDADPRQKMRLLALRSCVTSTSTLVDGRNPLAVVLDLADALDDDDHRLLALWALASTHGIVGQRAEAWACIQRFREVAEATRDDGYLAMADRMEGSFAFDTGNLAEAKTYVDRVLSRPPGPARRAQLIHRHMEQYVLDRSMQTLMMFLQGLPDQALRTEERNYAHAFGTGHALSQVNLLRQSACLIALYIGDIAKAEFFIGRLIELSGRHDLGLSGAMGACFEGMLINLRGDAAAGIPALRTAIERFRATGFKAFFPLLLSSLAERLGEAGLTGEGLAAIDEALADNEALGHRWFLAELLRVEAGLRLASGEAAKAEALLRQAIEMAHAQGALAWELRAAIDLAELQPADGIELLSAVYNRFTEGFARPDLTRARRLLESRPS